MNHIATLPPRLQSLIEELQAAVDKLPPDGESVYAKTIAREFNDIISRHPSKPLVAVCMQAIFVRNFIPKSDVYALFVCNQVIRESANMARPAS